MSKRAVNLEAVWADTDRCADRLKASVADLEADGMKPSFLAMACEDLAMAYAQKADLADYQRHVERMILRGQNALIDLDAMMEEYRAKAET